MRDEAPRAHHLVGGATQGEPVRPAQRRGRGFTLIDLLVSLSVITLLIGLLLPSLGLVRETTRRLVCASNVRQLALGLAMYAEDNRAALPVTVHATAVGEVAEPPVQMTMKVRTPGPDWDGLGLLYTLEYLPAPGVFYCPSHRGHHPRAQYEARWTEQDAASPTTIFSNYQYRAIDPQGRPVRLFEVPTLALVTDGLFTALDFNHLVGANTLWNDLSVSWFAASAQQLNLPASEAESDPADIQAAWSAIDAAPKNR
ncbi:MAG TPA: hypothetical protein VD963_00070 [Phycisphaerales bacterium]|nr:hypothetical protein [Phycisphaerales bacterium]